MDNPIFISYSTQDRELAFKIVQYLESNGHPCWIAPRNITSGMDYTDVINEAIEHCSALVLIFSEHSAKSQFVKKELTTAVSYNKTILPFKISQVELRGGFLFMLNNVQWIEATSKPESKFPEIIDGLEGRMSASAGLPLESTTETKSKRGLIITLVAVAVVVVTALVFLLLPKGSGQEQPAPADTVTEKPLTVAPAVDTTTKADTATVADQLAATTTKTETAKNETAKTKTEASKNDPKKKQTQETKPTKETGTTEKKTPDPVTTTTTEQPKEQTKEQPAVVTDPTTPQTATKAPTNARAQKMGRARRYLNNKKYQAALNIFEELKREDPSDKSLDALINECRSHL